jgi:hypothetical protein
MACSARALGAALALLGCAVLLGSGVALWDLNTQSANARLASGLAALSELVPPETARQAGAALDALRLAGLIALLTAAGVAVVAAAAEIAAGCGSEGGAGAARARGAAAGREGGEGEPCRCGGVAGRDARAAGCRGACRGGRGRQGRALARDPARRAPRRSRFQRRAVAGR